MAPKQRRSAEQEVERMYQKADLANTRLDYKLICKVCKDNPTAIRSVKSCLVALGVWPTPGSSGSAGQSAAPAPPAPPIGLAALTDDTNAAGGEGDAGQSGEERCDAPLPVPQELSDRGLKDSVHRNYSTWNSIPAIYWKYWLAACEPISFSAANQRALLEKAQRDIPKAKLLELAEFEWGLDLSALVGDERSTVTIKDNLAAVSHERKNIGSNLQLPADWSVQGYYRMVYDEAAGVCTLSNRVSGASAPLTVLQGVLTKPAKIEVNWSERRAYFVVSVNGREKTMTCMELLYPHVGIGQAVSFKRRRTSESSHTRTPGTPLSASGSATPGSASIGVVTPGTTSAAMTPARRSPTADDGDGIVDALATAVIGASPATPAAGGASSLSSPSQPMVEASFVPPPFDG